MAGVWEAHDELLDRAVAVKVLAQHLSEDERARARFEREARAAAGLSSHPNVATIYDVGEHEGRAFIVMELMQGGSVADVLRREDRIEHKRALRWLREAASGLDAAHAAGVVHRDVKPANLLLDDRDRLAIGDFGIARLAWEEQVTQTGQVLGTAAYLAPEQAMGEPAIAASDRYALAVVAFELLTGEKPFHGRALRRPGARPDRGRPAAGLRARPGALRARRRRHRPRHGQGPRGPLGHGRGVRRAPRRRADPAAAQARPAAPAPAGPPPRASSPRATAPRRPPPAAARGRRRGRPRRSGPGTGTLLAALAAALLDRRARVHAAAAATATTRATRPLTAARRRRRPKKKETPTPTAEKTAEPTARRGDRDGARRRADARAGGREAQGQRQPAPAAGLQPQQVRQVRRGAAGRSERGREGLQGQRAGEPVRLRAVRARPRPAQHRRPGGRDQDARDAPGAATPTTSAPRSRRSSKRPGRTRVSS